MAKILGTQDFVELESLDEHRLNLVVGDDSEGYERTVTLSWKTATRLARQLAAWVMTAQGVRTTDEDIKIVREVGVGSPDAPGDDEVEEDFYGIDRSVSDRRWSDDDDLSGGGCDDPECDCHELLRDTTRDN